jgi:histidine triad (HIT) family protein
MLDCIFCKISNKEIVAHLIWEDEKFLAFMDVRPVNPGHVLIIPRRHVEYIFALEEPFYTEIFQAAKHLASALQKASEAKRIGLVIEGFGVDHLHLHLIPINAPGELDSHRARPADPDELKAIAEKIKLYL